MGSLSLLQEIIPTQILNPGLHHYWQILYQLSYQGIGGCHLIRLLAHRQWILSWNGVWAAYLQFSFQSSVFGYPDTFVDWLLKTYGNIWMLFSSYTTGVNDKWLYLSFEGYYKIKPMSPLEVWFFYFHSSLITLWIFKFLNHQTAASNFFPPDSRSNLINRSTGSFSVAM